MMQIVLSRANIPIPVYHSSNHGVQASLLADFDTKGRSPVLDILLRSLTPSGDAAENAVGDETVILHLTQGTYYGLDPVGTQIWALLKDGVPPPEICLRLAAERGVNLATIEADARTFLGDLEAQGLLVDR